MKKDLAVTQKSLTSDVLRFAHPFYTPTHVDQRPVVNNIGTRMTDYIKTQLEPIPKPQRNTAMMLADIIGDDGVDAIKNAGVLRFHSVGDTGMQTGNTEQMVADAMSEDYDPSKPTSSPAFFFHLGDVNYYNNTDLGYHAQFYEAYKTYPGKIIAIPGNHDGELFKYDGTSTGQTETLQAFQRNFCQPKTGVPPAAGTIYREMVSQPGVYWYLNAPFADIIGLYSNVAENPGYISGPAIGNSQKDWLTETLKTIGDKRVGGERKGLLIATHHPPISSGFHSSSTEMLNVIDDCCTEAGIMPDVFLSAHAHNLQCYTRYLSFGGKDIQIPYCICGGGGRTVQHVPIADGTRVDDPTTLKSYHTFNKSASAYGYMDIKVTALKITIDIYEVTEGAGKSIFNTIEVDII